VIPQVKFGRPLEDGEPLLARAEFFKNMLIEPMPASHTMDDASPRPTLADEGKA
jgi:hypothetical protein